MSKRVRSEKQIKAQNRNYALMQICGMLANLKAIEKKSSNLETKVEIIISKNRLEILHEVIKNSDVESWKA